MGSFEFDLCFIHHVKKMVPLSQLIYYYIFLPFIHPGRVFSAPKPFNTSLYPWGLNLGVGLGSFPSPLPSIIFAPYANTDSFVIILNIGAFKEAANQFISFFSMAVFTCSSNNRTCLLFFNSVIWFSSWYQQLTFWPCSFLTGSMIFFLLHCKIACLSHSSLIGNPK